MKPIAELDEAAVDSLQELMPQHALSPLEFVMEAILNRKVPDTRFIVIPESWGVAS